MTGNDSQAQGTMGRTKTENEMSPVLALDVFGFV